MWKSFRNVSFFLLSRRIAEVFGFDLVLLRESVLDVIVDVLKRLACLSIVVCEIAGNIKIVRFTNEGPFSFRPTVADRRVRLGEFSPEQLLDLFPMLLQFFQLLAVVCEILSFEDFVEIFFVVHI